MAGRGGNFYEGISSSRGRNVEKSKLGLRGNKGLIGIYLLW